MSPVSSRTRLKPGFTFTRLLALLVAVVVLAVVVEHFVAGSDPPGDDCAAKEIDTGVHREGTCTEGGTKIAVVDRHGVLKLESLEARLLAVDEHKTIRGRLGSKTATSVSIFEPEALFSESEYGVIRTYR